MAIENERVERSESSFSFDLKTGTLVSSFLKDENGDIHPDAEEFLFESAEAQAKNDWDESVEPEPEPEPEPESESDERNDKDAKPNTPIDPIDAVLNDASSLKRMVNDTAKADSNNPLLMAGMTQSAAQAVNLKSTSAGMLANYLAHKIVQRRDARNISAFDLKIDRLNQITQRITPKTFNPNDPNAISAAKEYFKTTKGMANIKELQYAYKSVLDGAAKVAKGYRTTSGASGDLYQEQILKKGALYLKENKALLEAMKPNQNSDKTLFDDFKGGLGGLFDLAKLLLARLAILIGAVEAEKQKQAAHLQASQPVSPSQQQANSSASSTPRMG